jgi:acetyl-CoA carboxylase beta subunit
MKKIYSEVISKIMEENKTEDILKLVSESLKKHSMEEIFLKCEECGELNFELYEYEDKKICEICLRKNEFKKLEEIEQQDTGRRVEF